VTDLGADLHIHTTHSDGSCSPGEVVHAAANLGLAALAITDHDTTGALPSARIEAARRGVELIAGVEITCEFEGREVHILGHFFREDDPDLVSALDRLRRARAERFAGMVERLRELGYRWDRSSFPTPPCGSSPGRGNLADWLVRSRQAPSRRELFRTILADTGPVALPKVRLAWDLAVGLVRRAGGAASLAHPPLGLNAAALTRMIEKGLVGMEVAGPGWARNRRASLRAQADRLGLVPIAGSDFHAHDRPGRWVGSATTPPSVLLRLRATTSHEGCSRT
jgi:predicted metal-dependent phosphoesterase TrpH